MKKLKEVIFIFLICSFVSIPTFAETATCDSCADCNAKLADEVNDKVVLSSDIFLADPTQNCIDIQRKDVVFMCDDHAISSSPMNEALGTGINVGAEWYQPLNVTVKNCTLNNFEKAIMFRSNWGQIINVTVSDSEDAITVESVHDVSISGVEIFENGEGIRLDYTSSISVEDSYLHNNNVAMHVHRNLTESNYFFLGNVFVENGIGIDVTDDGMILETVECNMSLT
ncbi:MAG: right-handed parallel beta-helix repeat-containing protein, partial [Deltaproteobacteria bacterium]|nr:right-handed parallel beta-helix repeat-containing protein [Deltaproteobacteria bacterium]MBN2670471.1 right-handed parallel beta-helix repeat-containing protein [Deltaproteobacteria bacterium]